MHTFMAGEMLLGTLWSTRAARRSAASRPTSAASALVAPSSRVGVPKGSAAPLDSVDESAAAKIPSAAAALAPFSLRMTVTTCHMAVNAAAACQCATEKRWLTDSCHTACNPPQQSA